MIRRFTDMAAARVQLVEREEGESPSIAGYASVFYDGTADTQYELWPGVVERVMPGAFDRAVKEKHDVRGLFNHEPSNLLGRVSAKTMLLSTDKKGLRYDINPPDTQVARDVVTNIRAGNLSGSSFAFVIRGEEWRKEDGAEVREITDVDLFDVGPVTYPAYESTTTGVKSVASIEEAKASYERWRASVKAHIRRAKARARALEVARKS